MTSMVGKTSRPSPPSPGNVGDAEAVDRADEQAGAAGRAWAARIGWRWPARPRPPRGLDLYRLEKPRQWSAPLELPAANRSRRHDALMPIVDARLLGPECGGPGSRGARPSSCRQAASQEAASSLPDSGACGPLSRVIGVKGWRTFWWRRTKRGQSRFRPTMLGTASRKPGQSPHWCFFVTILIVGARRLGTAGRGRRAGRHRARPRRCKRLLAWHGAGHGTWPGMGKRSVSSMQTWLGGVG